MASGRIDGGVRYIFPFKQGFILLVRQVVEMGNEYSLLYLNSSGDKTYLDLPRGLDVGSHGLGEYYVRAGPEDTIMFSKRDAEHPGAIVLPEVYDLDPEEGVWSLNRSLPGWLPNMGDILVSVPLKGGRLANVSERGQVAVYDPAAGEVEEGVIPDWGSRDEFGVAHSSTHDHFFIRQRGNVKIYSWDNLKIPVYDIDLPDHENLFGGDCDISWVSTR